MGVPAHTKLMHPRKILLTFKPQAFALELYEWSTIWRWTHHPLLLFIYSFVAINLILIYVVHITKKKEKEKDRFNNNNFIFSLPWKIIVRNEINNFRTLVKE